MTDEGSHVVTTFVRNRGAVLLVRRRPDAVRFPGVWDALSGGIEDDAGDGTDSDTTDDADGPTTDDADGPTTDDTARACALISEETSLGDDERQVVRSGRPVEGVSANGDTLVHHPVLVETTTRDVDVGGRETVWTTPAALAVDDRETVPSLWDAYERVAPSVRSVAADDDHGAAALSVDALEVLSLRAALLCRERDGASVDRSTEWDELADLARRLREARPSMAVLRNRINRAMTAAASPEGWTLAFETPEFGVGATDHRREDTAEKDARAVVEATLEAIDRATSADEAAAAAARDRLRGQVLTVSRSGTVLQALMDASLDRIFVAESRPGREGVDVATELAAHGPVTLVPDAATAHVLATESIDAVVVGADTVFPDGRVVNKVGTRATAIAASDADVPVCVVTAGEKVSTERDLTLERECRSGSVDVAPTVDVVSPTFDVTPPRFVTELITEYGAIEPAAVSPIAETISAWEDWPIK